MGNYIPSGFLLRKSTLKLFGGYDLNAPLEDWYLVMQIAKYSKMKFIDKVFFSYRWHDSNSIKNEEIMALYSRLTSEYEEKILNTIDESKVMEDVIKIKKYGYCYKKQGIPNVLQVLTIKKGSKKIKKILVFNVPLFSYEKKI
jgi:alpha-1,3-rhamnosyltransferase